MRGGPVLAFAARLLAGCGEKKTAEPVDFAAYGDCRHQTMLHRKVAAALVSSGAKFFLVTGDLTDQPDEDAAWVEFRDIV